jgi:hypothetical protein
VATRQYIIKADFTADYSGKKLGNGSEFYKRTYQTGFSNVVLDNIEPLKSFNKNELTLGNDYIENINLNNVVIKVPQKQGEEQKYTITSIKDGILRNPVIIESGKAGGQTIGKVKGIIYAIIENNIADKPAESSFTPPIPAGNTEAPVAEKPSAKPASGGGNDWWKKDWFSGCLPNLLWLLLALLLLSLLFHGAPWLAALLKLLLALLALYLIFRFLGWLLRVLSGILAFIFTFLLILSLLSYLFSHTNYRQQDEKQQEVSKDDSTEKSNMKNDSALVQKDSADGAKNPLLMIHHRKWYDFTPRLYEGDLITSQQNYFSSRQNREGLNPSSNDFMQQFHQVYVSLASHDEGKMQLIYHLFDSIRVADLLNDSKFAEMIVTCVQDIPYRLVIDDPSDLDGRMLEYYRVNGALEHIKFGVQAPSEFMYNLIGDCDTRALFCYTALDHYGYDAAILVSEYYSHAVLGLAIPSTGSSVTYNGKRYYTWETTSKGFQLGQMAPDDGNMYYWNVILVNK